MSQNRSVVLIGPVAPPYCGGPHVKNQVLASALQERGVSVIAINTIRWKRDFLRLLVTVVRQCLATPRVFLSIPRKGRWSFLLLLHVVGLLRPLRVVLFPTGGLFATELQALPAPARELYLGYSRRCDLILAETERLASELRQLGLCNVAVLPNFKPSWDGSPPAKRSHAHGARILYLSRVHPEKGIEWLFEALDRLQAKGLRFQLDLYGTVFDGYKRQLLHRLSQRSYARYMGVLEDPQLARHISTYDMMVFPTLFDSEGMPAVLIDAAIAGLPVVASDWLANSEIVQNGFNGLLVSPGDVEDLAAKIALLIKDGDLRMRLGENARKVSERYTTDAVIGELFEHLDRVRWWE